MRSNDGLSLVRVIQALDVVEVRNIQRSDVVAESEGKVSQLAVVANIRVDGDGFLGLFTEIVEELCDTLLAVGIGSEGVDDPDLARVDGAVGFLLAKARR